MKFFTILAASLIVGSSLAAPIATNAQTPFALTKKGTAREMTAYDEHGNMIGYEVYEVENTWKSADSSIYRMSCYMLDKNHSNDGFTPMKMNIYQYDGGVIDYAFAGAIFRQCIGILTGASKGSSQSSLAKSKITVSGALGLIPNDMKAGNSLNDSKFKVNALGIPITISNYKRTVLGQEPVTTSAGTYNCLKVQEFIKVSVLMFSKTIRVISWYAPGIGEVKNQAFMNANPSDTTPDSYSVLYKLR
jgi:hypothetical protein